MNVRQIEQVYDIHAARYDRAERLTESILLGKLRMLFGIALEGDVLEIAIGSGLNLPYYTDRVKSAIGVDLSRQMLELARRRANEWDAPVDLAQMDAQHLGFPDDSFNTVAISLALCTVPHPERAVREMIRVCRPGGAFVFLEHGKSPNPLVYAGEKLLSPLQERSAGCSLIRDPEALIESQGLEVVTEYRRWFSIFRMMIARHPSATDRCFFFTVGRVEHG